MIDSHLFVLSFYPLLTFWLPTFSISFTELLRGINQVKPLFPSRDYSDLEMELITKPADCIKSISLRWGTNHKCLFASSHVIRSFGSFFSKRMIKSFASDENLPKCFWSKCKSLLMMLLIVSLWYSSSKGVYPAIN
jgi:hypothetical protein